MNKILKLLAISLLSILPIRVGISHNLPTHKEYIPSTKVELTKKLDDFLYDLAVKESSNNYTSVNRWGYLGKYQFNKHTLRGLGIIVSKEEFLSNPELQEAAIIMLLKSNKKVLRNHISKYHNTTVNGLYVTESGILAAAHLAGPKNVKKFLDGGDDPKDKLGTHLSTYLSIFSGYSLDL